MDTTKDSARDGTNQQEKLTKLEDRYRHELADDDERQELRDEIKRMKGE